MQVQRNFLFHSYVQYKKNNHIALLSNLINLIYAQNVLETFLVDCQISW